MTPTKSRQIVPKCYTRDVNTPANDTAITFGSRDDKKIIEENNLTTVMVTHNMQQAIKYGNRMIMLHEGKVQFDIEGKEKSALTVEEVVKRFGAELKDEALLC